MTQEQIDFAVAWFLHGEGPTWSSLDPRYIGPIASTFGKAEA